MTYFRRKVRRLLAKTFRCHSTFGLQTKLILCFCQTAELQKVLSPTDDRIYQLARNDLNAFAKAVSKGQPSELGQAKSIVQWLVMNFEWQATVYQVRTLRQIIDRRGGNCNELATVGVAAMKELGIKLRKVHEVHIRTESRERGDRADELIKENGNAYSIFGRHHNDHVYLEIYDSAANDWFPSDPWSGLIGTEDWLKARVWFGSRSSLAPDADELVVPIAIFAADSDGNFTIDRTRHYLIDEFGHLYNGRLHRLHEWKYWCAGLDQLRDKVGAAFAGKVNLHDYAANIDSLADIYDRMAKESHNRRDIR